MPLVTPQGFQPIPETIFAGLDAISGANAVDLPNDVDASAFAPQLRDVPLVRIPFPKSDDGRGFSLARRLRDLGYRGRLRAHGHVISDQFRYALECGFDEVEISDDLAADPGVSAGDNPGRTDDLLGGVGRRCFGGRLRHGAEYTGSPKEYVSTPASC